MECPNFSSFLVPGHIINLSIQSNHFRSIHSHYLWAKVRYIIRTYGSREKSKQKNPLTYQLMTLHVIFSE